MEVDERQTKAGSERAFETKTGNRFAAMKQRLQNKKRKTKIIPVSSRSKAINKGTKYSDKQEIKR